MKKILFYLLIIVLLVVGGMLIIKQDFISIQSPTIIPQNDNQEIYLRYLELGRIYENQGKLDKALTAYEQASLANQLEIAKTAQASINRIEKQKNNPIISLQRKIKLIVYLISNIVLPIILVYLFLTSSWYIVQKLTMSSGYYFAEFNDYTTTKLGQGFNSLVLSILQENANAYRLGQANWLGIGSLELPVITTSLNENPIDLINEIETIRLANIEVSPSKILNKIISHLYRKEYTLCGSIFQYNNQIRISAELKHTDSHKVIKQWILTEESEGINNCTISLAKQLGYNFLHHITEPYIEKSENNHPSTPECLSLYSQSLHFLIRDFNSFYPDQSQKINNYKTAEDMLYRASIIDPIFTPARYLLGITYLGQAKYLQAQACFKIIINEQRGLVMESAYYLALSYYYTFQTWAYAGAEYWFNFILENSHNESFSILALTHAGLANLYAQMISQGDAVKSPPRSTVQLSEMVDQQCNMAKSSKKFLPSQELVKFIDALTLIAQGIAAYNQEKIDKAIEKLTSSIQEIQNNPIAYGYIALAWLKKENPEEAALWLKRASQFQPFGAYLDYGYYKLGKYYEEKESDLTSAKLFYQKAPRVWRAQYRLAKILAQNKEYDRAITTLKQALPLDRKNHHLWANLSYFLALSAPKDIETLKEASNAASLAIKYSGNDPILWKRQAVLGWILSLQGNFDDALLYLDIAIKNKRNAQIYYYRAELFLKLNNKKQAILELKNAAKTRAKDNTQKYWKRKSLLLLSEMEKNEQIQ